MADKKTAESASLPETTKQESAQEPALSAEWLEKAKQGEEEFQLKVGQHYLTLADSSVDRDQNATDAVHWLTQASKQSNEDATTLLKECLENGTGITDENKEDVKWCIQTSSLEKKIRYAARNMFNSINTAHKEVLSAEEYQAAIKKVTGGTEQKLLLAAGKKIGDNISENEFVKLLSRKVQGSVTLSSTEHSDAYQAATPLEKVYKYPKETAMVLADQALEMASKDGLSMVMSCVPTDQIYFLALFFLYGLLTTNFLMLIVPLIVFYISFAIIIITTLQMFYKKKKLKEASALAEVLKQYNVGVDVNQTQSQYSWNTLTPYIVYFCAIPIVVVSFSLADKTYIPCAEFLVLSCVLCGICFMAISDSHDLVTLLALFCGFLAALPVFLEKFPDVPVLTSVIHLVSGSFTTIELFGGFRLNIGIPAICYLIIPCFFIQMAARNSFEGMYRVLVPHLVCYFWFNIVTTMYPFTTWLGLTRATVGYVMLPLLLPLSFFLAIIGIIYVFVKLASSDLFGKIVITLLLGCIPVLLTQTKKLFGGKLDKNKKFGYLKKALMAVFAVLAILPLIFVRLPSTSPKVVTDLSLGEYMKMCHPGDSSHTAALQIRCGQLAGTKVTWQGQFMHAKVASVTNDVAKMIDVFPSFIADPLRCLYGQSFGDCEAADLSETSKDYCRLMTSLGKECHLKEHDKFTFSFGATVSENDQVLTLSVDAGNGFKATLLALEPSDEVMIKGTLVDGLGTTAPKLKAKEVTCTSRELHIMKMIVEDTEEMMYELFDQSLKVAFNFFWYPLMEYVPATSPAEPAVSE